MLYSRVSTPHQAQHGQSLQAQPEALRAYAEAHAWTLAGELL
ncbi:MAG: recombinase family protein, partial [Planctomycetes bacterium]|nr:recombinase family protein [Planctomycetota bacterium]